MIARAGERGRYIHEVPFGLGLWEILIFAGILVLLFGAKGAPAMARRLGSGVRELKDAVGEMDPRSLLDSKDEAAEPLPRRELASAAPSRPPVEVAAERTTAEDDPPPA